MSTNKIKTKKIKIKGINKVFTQEQGKHPTATFTFAGLGVGGSTAKINLLAPTKKWLNWFKKHKITLLNWYHDIFGHDPKNMQELQKQVLLETQRTGEHALGNYGKVFAITKTPAEAKQVIEAGMNEISQSKAFIGESKYKLRILTKLIKTRNWIAPGEVFNWADNNFNGFRYVSNTSNEWYIEDMIGYTKKGSGYHEYLLMFDFSNMVIQKIQTR